MTSIRKFLGAGMLGVLLAAGAALPSAASEAGAAAIAKAQAQPYPGESFSQYYRRGYGGRGYRRGPSGGAIAGGVIGGLALGALAGAAIAGSQPAYGYGGPGAPVGNVYGADPAWVEYCASRYRSFDPRTGTYLARDGYRYPCE